MAETDDPAPIFLTRDWIAERAGRVISLPLPDGQLLPCSCSKPLAGRRAEVSKDPLRISISEKKGREPMFAVECPRCMTAAEHKFTKVEAYRSWNEWAGFFWNKKTEH